MTKAVSSKNIEVIEMAAEIRPIEHKEYLNVSLSRTVQKYQDIDGYGGQSMIYRLCQLGATNYEIEIEKYMEETQTAGEVIYLKGGRKIR